MNAKSLSAIIPMISVVVMLIWGFAGNGWSYSWLAVVVGGVIAACIRIVDKNRNESNNNKNNSNSNGQQ